MAIRILQKLGQQVSPKHCSHLPNETATEVFTNSRVNLKTQSALLIKLNHVLGDTLDFPRSRHELGNYRGDVPRFEGSMCFKQRRNT